MTFFRPTNLTELAACLAQKPEDCHLVAGCTDFLAKRNGQAWEAEALLSLSDVSEMKSITLAGDKLSIGAACYPEGHVECPRREKDIEFLKAKVDCGVDFLTTQMFFDNSILYQFLYRVLAHDIRVPIVAGIMPVINIKQIQRSCQLSGTNLPPRFQSIAQRFGDDPASMKQAGIAYATEQIIDLIANGVEHIHIYTMNKPDVAAKIMANLSDIIRCDGNS